MHLGKLSMDRPKIAIKYYEKVFIHDLLKTQSLMEKLVG